MKLILKAFFAGFFLVALVSFLNFESSGLATQENVDKNAAGVIAEFNTETVRESPLLPKTNKSFVSQSQVVTSTHKQQIATGSNKVESIGFGVQGLVGIVTIRTTVPVKFEELPKGEKRLNIKLLNVFLSEELQVSRDVNEFGSPVSFISTFKDPAVEEDVIVIVELKEDAMAELKQQENVLTLRVTKQSGEEKIKVSEKTQVVKSQPSAQSSPSGAPGSAALNTVESIGFEVKEGVGIVTIKTSAPVTYEEPPKEEKKLNISLQDVFLPEELQVSRNVNDFDSPVSFISSFRDPLIARKVIVVVELKEDAPVEVKQEGNFITVNIGTPRGEEELTEGLQPVPEGPLYAFDFRITTTPGPKKAYQGQLVSFDF